MEEETTTENEIDAQHQANMALLQELDPVAFNKYDFEFDTILQRLPTGMKPEDTIESHKERCVEEMTETHQFETMELADKFIKHRFADFKLEEENAEHRLYVCPHGQHEQCTGYAKVFLNVGVNIVRACFGHYGHETSIGQYRFTGIQFATIRLFTDFYWKKIVGPGWNVHNIVYCFKHWYDDSHALHYLSIYDLRAIATELGRPEAATVQLPNGVYHAFRMTSIEDMSHFAHRTPSNQFQPCHTDVKNIPAEEVPSLNSEGSSGPPQVLNENGDPVVSAHDEACDSCFRSFQSTAIKPPQEWYSEGANTQKVITMWHNIHNHATELKNIAFMKMLHPECTEEVFNDAQQIFEMLNQAAEIAHNMNEKIRKANGDMSQVPDLEQPPTFSVSLNDPIFQELYPNPHPDYMCCGLGMDEDNEIGLPQKGINQIIKEVVPEMRIANESRDLINTCCVEFVKHVAREAQRIASQDQRKTIYHEHVQKALQNLGFTSDYLEAADSVLDACKVEAEKKLRRKNSRLEKCGIPEEKLYEMQQELIKKARERELEQQQAAQQQTQAAVVAAANASLFGGISEGGHVPNDDYDN